MTCVSGIGKVLFGKTLESSIDLYGSLCCGCKYNMC